jgi:hypothetical protein
VDVRGTPLDGTDDVALNIEVGRVSLYDANGNLVDSVTYDADNVREAFASLQRDHPANPGERLNAAQNFKMRSYRAGSVYPWSPPDYYNVVADGAYDDWKFWNDPWLSDSDVDNTLSTTEFVNYSPNSRGSSGFMTPAEANNRSLSYDQRLATAECKVKDRNLAGPGELVRAPFFHEYIAVVGYDETVAGTNDDLSLSVGDVIINEDENDQTAIILAINTTNYGASANPLAPSGWMVLRGDFQNPVSTWDFGDWITDDSYTFGATISSVKMMDTYLGDELDFYVEIGYTVDTGTDPTAGNTITNTSKDPDQSGTATVVDTTDPDNTIIQLTMNQAEGDPVTEWKVGETISYSGGTATITSVRDKSADVRGLADYFTTAFIDLEADPATADVDGATGGYTLERWPDSDSDPTVYSVSTTADFTLTWDEDDGVQEGTYDLYSVVNYGSTVETEIPIYVGPMTVAKTSPAQQATLSLDVQNIHAAAVQYHFMRAVLAPPPQTFGRINANAASQRVLQGLPGIDSSLATSIINARNIAAFQSVGDVYLVSAVDSNFTPTVYKNISGLITTRSDVYKIIVLGQAAIDANDDGIIQEEEVTSSKKMEVIYQR